MEDQPAPEDQLVPERDKPQIEADLPPREPDDSASDNPGRSSNPPAEGESMEVKDDVPPEERKATS